MFRRFILYICSCLYLLTASQVFGAGLTIPAGSSLNVNACSLSVAGDVVCDGNLSTTTGTISLTGNWTLSSGTFTSNTGNVVFNASTGTTQVLVMGGLANAFYNLSHTSSGTVLLNTNAIYIKNTFTNSSGTFDTNDLDMTVAKDWNNTATFDASTGEVIFAAVNGVGGSAQTVYGATTFYDFTKDVSATAEDTISFHDMTASAAGQVTTNRLTLKGAASNVLHIVSTTNGTQAKMRLQAGGVQSIEYVTVKDAQAFDAVLSDSPMLVARNSPTGDLGNNENWSFGAATITWDGSASTDWDNAFNWDLGLVPAPGDIVIIPDTSAGSARYPVLATNAIIGQLTINSAATLTLNGKNLTVAFTGAVAGSGNGSLANSGNIILTGSETVTLDSPASPSTGTYTYVGNGDGTVNTRNIALTVGGVANRTFYNLIINDPNATKDVFQTNGTLTVNNDLTVTAGTLDTSTNSNNVTVTDDVTVNGGTWTATNSGTVNVDGDVTVSSGTLTAPSSTSNTAFTVAGNLTQSGAGTFTHSSGKLTLDGSGQSISGTIIFSSLRKVVAAADTLTIANTSDLSVVTNIVLTGASGQLLSLRSDVNGTAYDLRLLTGGIQTLDYLDVKDGDACYSGTSSGTPPVCSGTGILLVARHSTNSTGNDHWAFNGTTITWTGNGDDTLCAAQTSLNLSYDCQNNWDLGLVPIDEDTAIIPAVADQPKLDTNSSVKNLTLSAAGSTLTLNAKNYTIVETLSNTGTIKLVGSETVAIGTTDIDSGTFEYLGDADGNADSYDIVTNLTVTTPADNKYNNLVINSTDGASDTFTAVGSNLYVEGGFTLTAGVFVAPATAFSFTVEDDFTRSGGTFTHSSGRVTLDGGVDGEADGSTQTIYGSTTFYRLTRTTTTAAILKFDNTGTQTVVNNLILAGASGQLLSLRSDADGSMYDLVLLSGGTQSIGYVDVKDADACLGGTSSGTAPPVCSSGVGITLVGRNSTDSGNNDHWRFNAVTVVWTGTTSTDWDAVTPTNWDLGLIPISIDSAIVPNVTNDPIMLVNVELVNLTTQTDAVLNTSTFNLTITDTLTNVATISFNGGTWTMGSVGLGTFSNTGTVSLTGAETINFVGTGTALPDVDSGTFVYRGNGDGTADTRTVKDFSSSIADYYNLTINDVNATPDTFATAANLNVAGTVTVTAGTLNTSTASNSLTTAALVVNGGTYTATNSTIDVNGDVTISSGTLTAPSANTAAAFTISGSFAHSGGTFTHSSGRVTFDTTNTATISGNTTFSRLYATTNTTGAKQINFEAGSTTTVANTLNFSGYENNRITLRSTTAGTQWIINVASNQYVAQLDVMDSNANNSTITCLNCQDSGNNNSNWIFQFLGFIAPNSPTGIAPNIKTVGLNPVLVGLAPPAATVVIRQLVSVGAPNPLAVNPTDTDTIVATVTADAGGKFFVILGADDASLSQAMSTALTAGEGIYLRPFIALTDVGGDVSRNLTAVASPDADKVPQVLLPADDQRVSGAKPTIEGIAKKGQSISIYAKDQAGALLIQEVATGTVNNTASSAYDSYAVTLTTSLTKGINYLVVIVDGIASNRKRLSLTDPFGVVFDSSSNKLIKNATVTIYRKSDNQIAEKSLCANPLDLLEITTIKDIDCYDTNPFTTGADGFYFFLTASSDFYIRVSATGYAYPSTLTEFPVGRTIVTGSKGEDFTVGSTIIEMDHPLDANGYLLRIEKDANKSQVRIGDVITYTIQIQNLSADNAVEDFMIDDRIPPGFKYLPNRVLLDGVPLAEPVNTRPMLFNIGDIQPGATRVLKYQLVVGSGVLPGKYENVAVARYTTGVIISNRATKTVSVIPDPLFDLGTVIGKVFYDWNENGLQDEPEYDATEGETVIEKPVPNVQIVTEDGTVITTDRDGKYNLPGLLPGRHILRVDERSLPPGAYLTTDKAIVVDIAAGALSKVNFGVNMDNAQIVGADAQFFNEKIQLTQNQDKPVLRLNAAMYNPSAHAPAINEIAIYESVPIRQVEFRIFTNYAPFIDAWYLDIIDVDTKKLVKRFQGTRFNIHDPIFFNGRDSDERLLRADRNYAYVLTVKDAQGQSDKTAEMPFKLRVINNETDYKAEKEDEKDKDKIAALADHYRKWLETQLQANILKDQRIPIEGETVRINRHGIDIRAVRIMKEGSLFAEVPISQADTLTPQRLLTQGAGAAVVPDNLEIILPKGDYTMEVISPQSVMDASGEFMSSDALQDGNRPSAAVSPGAGSALSTAPAGTLNRFTRNIKVGDDYFMFVAMGDGKVGYNFNQGNIEPVQSNERYQEGFWSEGKAAYYLKGKIKGKYLITSSFDTQREQKELFRKLDPDTYYPIYGDQSSINYDATNTKGPLYLLVEWDKSSVIWGNYAVDFDGNEFAAFSRNYYGGKIDYQSVASNPYGDARTKVAVFHAEIQERPAHNEFLGTGGSLYFLKHKKIVPGSDKIRLEVRDQVTGLVISTKEMKNGADYELDDAEGRIIFWQPVAMIARDLSIVAENLLDGNPIYVVADYQYAVKDVIKESSQGARVAQAVGDNLVVGSTFVKETQAETDSLLRGTDALLHLGPDATIKAQYAQSDSQGTGTFISTDGGISFSELTTGNIETGTAYGLTGDARLFSRIGINAYYKWVENTFNSPATTSQQGKETSGMALTFDVTPVTRLTARQDIQKLIQNGNLQTTAQVGASETTTTLIQLVHEAERLKLTGAYQIKEVKDKIDGIETSTNEVGKVLAGKAEYALTGKVNVSVGQQFDINDPNKAVTTVGADAQVTDRLSVRVQEAFSPEGTATTVGATTRLSDKVAVSTDYALAQKKGGEIEKTVTVGAEGQLSDKISTSASVAMSESSTGEKNTSTTLGAKGKIADNVELDAAIGVAGDATGQQRRTTSISSTAQVDKDSTIKTTFAVNEDGAGGQTKSIALDANRKVDEKTESTSTVKVDEDALGGKTTTVAFTDKKKLNDELQAVSERAFNFNADGSTTKNSKYGVLREKDGRVTEASLTRKLDNNATQVSESNIFGLSGDVNDKVALNSSFERGRVQNLDGTSTNRTAITLGAGYVLKDTETAVERLKNSTKIELRLDDGVDDKRQFVFYNALEGKLTDNLSTFAKLEYSKTENTTTGQVEARHKEIILGAAYRPVNVDNLNLIARYTYKEGQGPTGQINTDVGIEKTRMQVFAGEAIYDIDENWQLAEKFALRINEEKTADFEFNKTHTWLMIHRLNYRVDRNWTLGGEYRRLTQVEAKDSKSGFLLEATRNINDNTQLGIGWNFTQFSDDLTNLSYTSQGPFLRMTGKLYDRTPQEKARARAKWLDERVSQWAWVLVKKELAKQNSPVVNELNNMFGLGKAAQAAGRLEESRQIYKDIVTAGQMMFDEASEYIRLKIATEEKLQEYSKTAEEYFKGGEYEKARKIWEKVVEDASKGMVK